jgi:uncharacterized protein YlaI
MSSCVYCEDELYCKPNWSKELKGWVCDDCKDKLQKEKEKISATTY